MIIIFLKDLKIFLKDRRSVLLTFLLPIALITLFALAYGNMGKGDSASRSISLLVADLDSSAASRAVIVGLDTTDALKVRQCRYEEGLGWVKKGDYSALLVLHAGFQDSIMANGSLPAELFYDELREMEVGLLQPLIISKLFSSFREDMIKERIEAYLSEEFPDLDPALRDKILNDALSKEAAGGIDMDNSGLKLTSVLGEEQEESDPGLVQAVAGTAIMMLLFSVAGLGSSLLEEKESGTLRRLLISPLRSSSILYGKMLFAYFIAIVQLIVMFLFANLVFGLKLSTNVPALILMIASTAFAVSAFGIFLASVSKTRQQAQSLSTLVILIMSAIGGSMLPLFIMPAILQKIAYFSVNYWGIQGFYDIFWRGLPLIEILPRIGVLTGIGLLMTLISIRLFRKNILKLI